MSANQQSDITSNDSAAQKQGSEAIASLQKVAYTDLPAGVPSLSSVPEQALRDDEQLALDQQSISDEAKLDLEKDTPQSRHTVLYLAYGSNLSEETFLGKRQIRPLSQQNVVVPELSLSFNHPGMPYFEPCFANTRFRSLDPPYPNASLSSPSEKAPLLEPSTITRPDYHKDRWHKGLVGVVYEVTRADYAKIIVTEGAGSSYKDIMVECYPLPPGDTVPEHPDTVPFKAHTLFLGHLPQRPMPGQKCPAWVSNMPLERPDESYAQPSARYLKLITTGAEQHSFPLEYKQYLYDIRSYTITSRVQKLGKVIFLGIWGPPVFSIFLAYRLLSDRRGRAPSWIIRVSDMLFSTLWATYDSVFKRIFGDGERTFYQNEHPKLKRRTVFGRLSNLFHN